MWTYRVNVHGTGPPPPPTADSLRGRRSTRDFRCPPFQFDGVDLQRKGRGPGNQILTHKDR